MSELTEKLASVSNLTKTYEEAKKIFEINLQQSLKEVFDVFFKEVPEINIVGWSQYTPYFNDGEPCEFRVSDFFMRYVDEDELTEISSAYELEEIDFPYQKPSEYMYKNENGWYTEEIASYEKAKENPRFEFVAEACAGLDKFLYSIPEEIFLAMFDNHVTVFATANGIDTQEYDHE